tara:strand:+ start:135 stop:875 length:741 start_codon:yes stop_codon:yes gene_type:complete
MNKNIFNILILIFTTVFCTAQTATDFTSDDCNGTSYNLYSELDAGYVVVLCWVMPCGPCALGAEYAQNAVQSFNISHPGKVKYYIVDDYANSDCNYLNSWNTSYQLSPDATFSSPLIDMNDYGGSGMPKVVVIGPNKQVYYNGKNNQIDELSIINGINQSLQISTDVQNISNTKESSVYYDNQNKLIQLSENNFNSYKIFSISGELVAKSTVLKDKINVQFLIDGLYIIQFISQEKTYSYRFLKNN